MEPGLAKKLLKILKAGDPVPENMRGVWTEEDDRCVESQDARDVERVTTKHGDRLFQARWEYLEMARERGLVQ
jgi:telomeric repeat-binding factor 2-interacting protein 1